MELTPEIKLIAGDLAKCGLYLRDISILTEVPEDVLRAEIQNDPKFKDVMTLEACKGRRVAVRKLVSKIKSGSEKALEFYLERIAGLKPDTGDMGTGNRMMVVFAEDRPPGQITADGGRLLLSSNGSLSRTHEEGEGEKGKGLGQKAEGLSP